MALRVLLADESSTIKKVMQLALADFGVEVKSVPVGLDVLAVAKTFKPDIIFADVLLTKRTGYEVSGDLKSDSETSSIPVVLMWSGFMEIDEARASHSRADRRLEKPFDAEQLRTLVSDLVPKTKSNPVSHFLSFPEMPQFEETPATPAATPQVAIPGEEIGSADIYGIPEVDADEAFHVAGEEFSSVPLTRSVPHEKTEEEMEEGGWSHQDLTKFKIKVPEVDENDFATKFIIPQDELTHAHIEVAGDFEEISFGEDEKSVAPPPTPAPKKSAPAAEPVPAVKATPRPAEHMQQKSDINADLVEKILREEARQVIESVCWKILPEIAERLVRDEIQKLLREAEKSI